MLKDYCVVTKGRRSGAASARSFACSPARLRSSGSGGRVGERPVERPASQPASQLAGEQFGRKMNYGRRAGGRPGARVTALVTLECRPVANQIESSARALSEPDFICSTAALAGRISAAGSGRRESRLHARDTLRRAPCKVVAWSGPNLLAFVRLFVCLSVCLLVRMSVRPFVCLFVWLAGWLARPPARSLARRQS